MHRASIAPVTGFRTTLVLALWIVILPAAARVPASPLITATDPTTEWTGTGLSGISRRYYLLTLP